MPINFMLTADEIAYILGHSEPAGFVVEPNVCETAEQAMERVEHVVETRLIVGDSQPWLGATG